MEAEDASKGQVILPNILIRERLVEVGRLRAMVRYICFIQLTPEFLKLSLEERERWIPKGVELAKKHGLKVLFWGSTLGVRENAVVVFEGNCVSDGYVKFLREWQGLGTPKAGRYIGYTRTVTVY